MFHHPSKYPRPEFARKELRNKQFFDRFDAGRRLGEKLLSMLGDEDDVIVVALPRGGVAVADEIARMLSAPLDTLTVCKIGSPRRRELAIGAISPVGTYELDGVAIDALAIDPDEVRRLRRLSLADAVRRDGHYRHDRQALDVLGRDVVLVDDGAATGATMRVAIRQLRSMHPRSITVALPVAPPDVVRALMLLADEVVCLVEPAHFDAVSDWYVDFHQMSDVEACAVLDDARELTIH